MTVPINLEPGVALSRAADTGIAPDAAWRLRFWLIFSGQTLSLLGSALTQFVLFWWIADTTASASALATAGMAALLPHALLSPLGGTFADRYSRRMLMIVADSVSALCMLWLIALFLSGRIELWQVYTMMAIRSAMQAFQTPAAMASVSMLVPGTFLGQAAGLNQTLQSLTTVAAAPLGALAISMMPIGWALSIDVVTAVLGIVPLMFLRIPQVFATSGRRAGLLREFHEGVQLIWNTPGLRQLYALLSAVVLVVMPCFMLVPLLVKEHFGGGATQVALMESLSGIGMMIGAMVMTVLNPQRRIPWILVGFAASCLTLALTGLAPRSLFGVAVTWFVISGATFVFGNVPLTALLQATIPNHLQGRALSLLSTVMGLAAPVGLALISPLGELLGVHYMFALAGLLGALVSLSGFLSRPLLRLDTAQDLIRDHTTSCAESPRA